MARHLSTKRRGAVAFDIGAVHRVLSRFAVAVLVASLLFDLAYAPSQFRLWAEAAKWCVGAGLVSSLFAVVFGTADVFGRGRIGSSEHFWKYLAAAIGVVALAMVSFALRYVESLEYSTAAWHLPLSAVLAALVLYSLWSGRDLRQQLDARLPKRTR